MHGWLAKAIWLPHSNDFTSSLKKKYSYLLESTELRMNWIFHLAGDAHKITFYYKALKLKKNPIIFIFLFNLHEEIKLNAIEIINFLLWQISMCNDTASLSTASVHFFSLASTTWADNFQVFHSRDPVYTQKLALTSMRSVGERILQKHGDLKVGICVKIRKSKFLWKSLLVICVVSYN